MRFVPQPSPWDVLRNINQEKESTPRRPRCGLRSCFADSGGESGLQAVSHWGRQWTPLLPQLSEPASEAKAEENRRCFQPEHWGCTGEAALAEAQRQSKFQPSDGTCAAGLRSVDASGKGDARPCTHVTTCKRTCCYLQLIASSTVVCKGGCVASLAAVFVSDSFTTAMFASSCQAVVQDWVFC